MKISKNASGKNVVKLSQKEWEDFGKKAGWLDGSGKLIIEAEEVDVEADIQREAQPAPAAPPRTKPGQTPTEKPGKNPGRRDRRKPSRKTNPKGRKPEVQEGEAEEVSADNLPTIASELQKLKKKVNSTPSIPEILPHFTSIARNKNYFQKLSQAYPQSFENFWGAIPGDMPFANSEFIRSHGGALSKANYEYLVRQANEKNLPVSNNLMVMMRDIMQTLSSIKTLERGNEEELVELAKDVIAEEWNVDRDELNANFMNEPGGSGKPEDKEGDEVPLSPEIRDEIGKRSALNGLSQGAGLHALLSIHHHPTARDRINEISPELLPLYDKFGSLISQSYYLATPEQLDMMQGQLTEQGTGWTETNEEGDVEAQGMTFSIVCQELVKGLVNRQNEHQFDNRSRQERGLAELSDEEFNTIVNNADKLHLEPMQIQFGTELWRKFLAASSGEGVDKLDVLQYVSASPLTDFDDTMNVVTEDAEAATEKINGFQTEVEENDYGFDTGPAEGEEGEEDLGGLGEIDSPDLDAVPEDQMGETPDDWDAIQRELFGDPAPQQEQPFGEVNQGLPPVEFDDDDDDDRPFWMN